MNFRIAGIVLVLLAGCSASHTASSTSVLPGAPGFTSQEGVNPFNLNTKNVVDKYSLGTITPDSMATGSDKNVWFTELSDAHIGKITPTGIVTYYAIPSGTSAQYITPGASGTLWFNENYYTIGKITTTGHVTEFPLPPGDHTVGGLAKGPDGNIWFCDNATVSIGKMTPTGVVTEYAIPSGNQPGYITAGPDGNLWFTEYNSQIGKITTAGVVTEYPGGVHPQEIVAGPDGNLYASDESIDRITTDGMITSYTSGSYNWYGIVLGPDKQMWMASYSTGLIEEFNPKTQTFSAAIQPDPASTGLYGLTVGGDGDVWIASSADNSILVYEEKLTTIGIRLNGELSFTDPNYGFELGYAAGTTSNQTQTISLGMGESVQFKNVDTIQHSAAFLGNATANNAPWPATFTGSTIKSPAGTAIGTTGWATGSLNPNRTSPIYETGLPGFYMIGDQYDYVSNNMRTVVIVH